MSVFRKSILKAGRTYHSPDGQVPVTPARLRHWEKEIARLQSASYAIPMHFDHSSEIELLEPIQMDVLEKKRNRSSQATVGRLERFTVAPDGQSAEIVVRTDTPSAKEVVENNTVFVSPVIFPQWKDGAGNVYRDVITSIDLVDHPVDYSQSSFQPAVRMGLPSTIQRLGGLRMTTKAKPRNIAAIRARLANAVRLGLVDEDDEYKKPIMMDGDAATAGEGSEVGGDTDGDAAVDTTMEPSASEMGVDEGEAFDKLDSVLNLLAEFGVTLPDDTTDANLVPMLRAALTALINAEEPDGDEVVDELDDDEEQDMGLPSMAPGAQPTASAPNIATMSVQQRAAITFAENQHKANINRQIDLLLKTGRCTPAEADAQKRAMGAVRLSLTDDGTPIPSKVEEFIANRKPLPKGTFWSPDARQKALRLSVSEPPNQWNTTAGRSSKEINAAIAALGGDPNA